MEVKDKLLSPLIDEKGTFMLSLCMPLSHICVKSALPLYEHLLCCKRFQTLIYGNMDYKSCVHRL